MHLGAFFEINRANFAAFASAMAEKGTANVAKATLFNGLNSRRLLLELVRFRFKESLCIFFALSDFVFLPSYRLA